MKVSNPELKVVRFANEDVIATSGYFMSATDFNSLYGTSFTSDYVRFNGYMTGYDDAAGGWAVAPNLASATNAANDEIEGVMSGGSYYFADFDVTVDTTHMAPIAQQHYGAYSYEGGLYTKGASYYELYWQ